METICDKAESELRCAENCLESVGRLICSEKNGGPAWQHINRALSEVRAAIQNCYLMNDEG